MTRVGTDQAKQAPPLASAADTRGNGARKTPAASPSGAAAPAADPGAPAHGGSFVLGVMFALLTLGLVVATSACLAVAGLALGVWPAAVIDALAEGAVASRAGLLAAALAAPLAISGLLHLSWGAFTKAKAGRCADWMIVALAASLGVYSLVFANLF